MRPTYQKLCCTELTRCSCIWQLGRLTRGRTSGRLLGRSTGEGGEAMVLGQAMGKHALEPICWLQLCLPILLHLSINQQPLTTRLAKGPIKVLAGGHQATATHRSFKVPKRPADKLVSAHKICAKSLEKPGMPGGLKALQVFWDCRTSMGGLYEPSEMT